MEIIRGTSRFQCDVQSDDFEGVLSANDRALKFILGVGIVQIQCCLSRYILSSQIR